VSRLRDRAFALSVAATLLGTVLISAVMLAGMYSPGTAATHKLVAAGAVGGSAGSAGTKGGSPSSGGHGTRGGGGGGGGGVPQGVTLPSQGVSHGVIQLGSIVTQSGPGRSTTMADAIIAWEKSVNAAGGIDGYRIEVDGGSTVLDDQGNPDLGASEYRELWDDQKVFAFVGECAPLTDEQMVSWVQQNDVPLVGECQSAPNAYSPPGGNACYCIWVGGPTPTQNGELGALLMGQVQHWPTSGGQIALVCLDDPTTIQDCNGAAQQYGSGALWNGGPQMEQIYDNNYSDLIAQWESQGITHVHLVLDPGSVDRYLQAAANADYNPQVFNNLVIDDGIAGTGGYSNANGMYIGTPWTPLDQSTPGMQSLEQAMATYFPGTRVDLYAQTAWISCLIFQHALEMMGHNLSEANLISTLNSINGWNTGLGPTESYSATNHVGPFESSLMQLQGAGTADWRLVTVHGPIS
jgi:ABC-type branched-subunit amino acid transport system substrate-binding protein